MADTHAAQLRRLWLNVHLWIGVGLAVLLVPISLSGALLVWHDEIDAWINPHRYAVSGAEVAHAPMSPPRGGLGGQIAQHTTPTDLTRETPCVGWTLADLLSHMIAQHRGFAAAATGAPSTLPDWEPHPLSDDPVAEYSAAADDVIAAFADVTSGDSDVWLPELARRPFAASDALTFQLVDDVVHAWDLARALDVPLHVDFDLAEAALAVALRVPDDAARRGPGFAFAPGLPVTHDASTLDRTLLLLGRSPAWPH